jgi:hypothetical protein
MFPFLSLFRWKRLHKRPERIETNDAANANWKCLHQGPRTAAAPHHPRAQARLMLRQLFYLITIADDLCVKINSKLLHLMRFIICF